MSESKTTKPKLFDRKEERAIGHFITMIERRAEKKMLKTGKLEGSHYAAMKELQKEFGCYD